MEINVNSWLQSYQQDNTSYKINDLESNKLHFASALRYIRYCTKDTFGSIKCKKCGEYTCSEKEQEQFKFCPRCGEKLNGEQSK